jgi:predicted nucleic acid-binding protein
LVFAIAFLDALDLGFCDVERVSKGDESLAIDLVRSHEDKTYSLCDAMSFVVAADHVWEIVDLPTVR